MALYNKIVYSGNSDLLLFFFPPQKNLGHYPYLAVLLASPMDRSSLLLWVYVIIYISPSATFSRLCILFFLLAISAVQFPGSLLCRIQHDNLTKIADRRSISLVCFESRQFSCSLFLYSSYTGHILVC